MTTGYGWASRSRPTVYLLMAYGKAEEVSEYAATPAREHGLVRYHPQSECRRA
ncbi:hypothetical protein [Streptomyces dioscori]|uniref:hypothetical protein n=1 Tax=Streptomyces dioscori TaxID=2109333 RepID=UPI00131DAC83|nr:hypothetical protein [Streptomyces dioscori]